MKFIFIDDNKDVLNSLRKYFRGNPDVIFAECRCVKDALDAIAEHQPDVIFLDHSLSEKGNEGLEIADRVPGIKIYSTTDNDRFVMEYLKRGIEHVGKTDIKKLKAIIAA